MTNEQAGRDFAEAYGVEVQELNFTTESGHKVKAYRWIWEDSQEHCQFPDFIYQEMDQYPPRSIENAYCILGEAVLKIKKVLRALDLTV